MQIQVGIANALFYPHKSCPNMRFPITAPFQPRKALLIAGISLVFTASAWSVPIDVEEILFEDGIPSPENLSGTVDMSWDGLKLSIVLTNTSGAIGVAGAGNLLTGIGFQLPGTLIIGGGTTGDLSLDDQWGFNNLTSGHYNFPATLATNTQVSTMTADTQIEFDGSNPDNVNGPSWGILSAEPDAESPGGQSHVVGTITFEIDLTGGTVPADIVSQINGGNVVLTFGSPKNSNLNVPDGGTTAALLGVALLGLGGARRALSRKS